jgi:hypothetical protein
VLGRIWPKAEGLSGAAWRPIGRPGPAVAAAHSARAAWSPQPKPARWHGRPRLAGGSLGAGSRVRARGRWEGCTGQEERQCSSPRRSGVGEVAGRGQRGGVLTVEDDSRGRGQPGVDPTGR